MVQYYAARAKEYERIYSKPERQDDLARLRDFVARAFAGLEALEVACGTGYWTEILAHSAASVVATDVNPQVLAIARAKPTNSEKVGFLQADAYFLPIGGPRFTGGLAAFWWSHVPKSRLKGFLESFHYAFKPGARIVFLDNVYVEGSSTPISRTDDAGNTYQCRQLDDGSTHEVLKNFPNESELRVALEHLAVETHIKFLPYYWMVEYVVPTGDAAGLPERAATAGYGPGVLCPWGMPMR